MLTYTKALRDSGWRNIVRRIPSNSVFYMPGLDWGNWYTNTILDYSGSGNNGTISGATLSRLPSGLPSLFFDGATAADDLVTVTDAASIQNIFDAGGTLDIWLYVQSDGEGDAGVIFNKRPAANQGWQFGVFNQIGANVSLRFYMDFDGGADGDWQALNSIPINTRCKVTLTYNSSSVANDPIIYVNGVPKAITEAITPIGTRVSDATRNLILGNNAGGTNTFDGYFAIPSVYSTIKSQAQITDSLKREYQLFYP